jgi:hypothetical protein
MLSGPALDLAFELRALAGPLIQDSGLAMDELRAATQMSDDDLQAALKELATVRFIALHKTDSGTDVIVLAPLQIYLDDLENQGADDM